MMEDFGGHGWGMGFGMGWWWIIGIVLVVVILWLVFRNTNNTNQGKTTVRQSPLDVLKERYAKGEINKDEYEERRKELNQ